MSKISVINSARNTLVTACDTVTGVISSANQVVQIGTTYVGNRSKRVTLVDKEKVMLATAKDLAKLEQELDADEKVRAIFDKLADEW